MSYCAEHAVPHSHFLGGPDEWTETDRAKVIAFTIERGERCSMCGTAPWEWVADPNAYMATTEICLGCQRRDALAEDNAAKEGGQPKGSRVVLLPAQRALEILRNPRAYAIDSPSARRRRRREAAAE